MPQERRLPYPAAVFVVGLGLALSGCAYSMSEFAQSSPVEAPAAPVVLSDAVPTPSVAPTLTVAPTALAEEEAPPLPRTAPAQPSDDTASVAPQVAAVGYPNINAVPPKSKGKLLTPEEKAKVIADLEALARTQGKETEKVRQAQAAECAADAAKALDAKPPLKGDNQAAKC
jgi:hypothetical protein